MPFYRFESLEEKNLTPHLSSGRGPIIEGQYIYFCKVSKKPGTGSVLHYHPNELIAFCLEGKMNALAGKDRRIVVPGTFIHLPPYARHQIGATEDGPMNYLYIKDQTWTVVGVAEDESVPDHAPTIEEVEEKLKQGKWPGSEKKPEKSAAKIEGLGRCYYPVLDSLDAPSFSASLNYRVEGERMAFAFRELPSGYQASQSQNEHEEFSYLLSGNLEAQIDKDRAAVNPGGILHVPKGSSCKFKVDGRSSARLISVWSKPALEAAIAQGGKG
jgi:quercetin dioxygenase-like cupin family protein